jgi:M6 family metalloprotease-like protein
VNIRLCRTAGFTILCRLIPAAALIAFLALGAVAGDRVLVGKRVVAPKSDDQRVHYRCLTCESGLPVNDPVNGHRAGHEARWALPSSLAADTTIHCLVLRFNFQYESTDDPNTTGLGQMNVTNPLANPTDSAEYYGAVGHWIDPPPHDSTYFNAHLRALSEFWRSASRDILDLSWDIYPYGATGTYTLPDPMSSYGICSDNISDIIGGLEKYFVDCIQLADTAHVIDSMLFPDIDFSQYDAIFLFHAGSDRQNDIGFPATCSDLFTGFIRFGDSVAVDGGTRYVRTALLMPETASQDNRATALNAVMAHEFGHQLGLVDLYSTRNFMTQLGDFALMDDNGFGTGVDFGFAAGNVFGTVPVLPSAWSRAYLGYDRVVDVRDSVDIRLVAATAPSDERRVARIPISEKEYYLLENRVQDIYPDPGGIQRLQVDSSNVILWPVRVITTPGGDSLVPTGEYDALMPGNGMVIYHVDESVAGEDYDGDGQNNFDDNQLQLDPYRRFISVVEADGLVNFGGYYHAGFGSSADLYRDDRNSSLTPNTNPPSVDNTGNNSHIYVTDIRRDKIFNPVTGDSTALDTVMIFSVETDKLANGFPVRMKLPTYPLTPIADDLDNDGTDEIIAVSDNRLFVFTTKGENFIHQVSGCDPCTYYGDSSGSTVNPGTPYLVPLYAQVPGTITAGPVTGSFGGGEKLIAVGYDNGGTGAVAFYHAADGDLNGQADLAAAIDTMSGLPIAMSFGEQMHVLNDLGVLYVYDTAGPTNTRVSVLDTFAYNDTIYHGICRLDDTVYVLVGDSSSTTVTRAIGTAKTAQTIDDFYPLGPVVGDLDRDGVPELIACGVDGGLIAVPVSGDFFETGTGIQKTSTGFEFTTNPVLADVDSDGTPDVVIGGVNALFAFKYKPTLFGEDFIQLTGFPIEVNDKYPDDDIISPPIVADLQRGGMAEIVFPTLVGNVYSFGPGLTFGFPLSGGERGAGSSLYYTDSTGGYLGYLGADGWFYSWEVDADTTQNFWPMGGADPSGSFAFDSTRLGPVAALSEAFDGTRFYNYPNPVLDGRTTFRYYLNGIANNVRLRIFDLSGREIASLQGSAVEGTDNEVDWDCSDVTPGVYRCMIEVEYSSGTKHAFTDVAVIR